MITFQVIVLIYFHFLKNFIMQKTIYRKCRCIFSFDVFIRFQINTICIKNALFPPEVSFNTCPDLYIWIILSIYFTCIHHDAGIIFYHMSYLSNYMCQYCQIKENVWVYESYWPPLPSPFPTDKNETKRNWLCTSKGFYML